jgi:hypothetical protein
MVGVADLLARIHVNEHGSSYDPVALGALAPWSDLRIWLAGVQGPQHGDVGHHNNAALFGGRDQKFHCDLPMLALGFAGSSARI